MSSRTIREIGGEIWAELEKERKRPDSPVGDIAYSQTHALVDLVMSILARHADSKLVNDKDLPVSTTPFADVGHFESDETD